MESKASASREIESPCDVLRPSTSNAERTLCVLGLGGGGTSMVAGCLRLAGVSMGERLNEANNEDQEFHDLIQCRPLLDGAGNLLPERLEQFRAFIEYRNERHPVWGWKHPETLRILPQVLDRLRNPHLLYIFRDVHAVAQRNHKRLGLDHPLSLRASLGHLTAMVNAIEQLSAPTLLISYERCLRHPEKFLRLLSSFCGLELTQKDCQDLASFVRPDRVSGEIDAQARARDRAYYKPESD
ncbi:hypothetical protein [Limibacillus halophilus]|uniref:Sulfotransferase family protein n=1 Tax=Limibacillus halophilus TaxID=1579333 RepID=A0A839SUZ7_9PROT|nr:hypothetical protein [Limibacillus halophilus]MBB3065510.1 hypothetical protein [Limibacillus halophilus]